MIQHFDSWNILKKELHNLSKPTVFKEGEILWCSLGINIGHEENGKNEFFNRPILVVKKFNKNLFLGIPLTTKIKENKFYHSFYFKGLQQCAMLSQIRVWSSDRLTHKMGELPKSELNNIRDRIKEMI